MFPRQAPRAFHSTEGKDHNSETWGQTSWEGSLTCHLG